MKKYAPLFLKIGLAAVFLYAAIASFIEPDAWIGYLPMVLRKMIDPNLLLQAFSIVEMLLSLWLLSGKKTFYAALVSAVLMFGVVATNFGAMDIVFRDVGLFFAALALMAESSD